MPSFFVPEMECTNLPVRIEGEEFHHLVNVFRHKRGDEVSVTNGRGKIFRAVVEDIGKKALTLRPLETIEHQAEPPLIAAAFSLLRNKNDFFIIEKLTELGIGKFFPFTGKRTVRSASDNTQEKFLKTAISAIKQCDNPFLPDISETDTLLSCLKILKEESYLILVALEREAEKSLLEIIDSPLTDKIVIFVGPEGGFADEEIELFREYGALSFTICSNILRAETAAVAAASQLIMTINNLKSYSS